MSATHLRAVYLLVAINVLIQLGDIPVWVIAYGLVFILWRWLADVYNFICPGRWGAALLGVLGTAGVWFEYKRIIGDPASSALLVIFIALKTLEVRSYRDMMTVTYLCLFLLMAKLLNTQSIGVTVFLFLDVTAITALMYLYHQPYGSRGLPWRRAIRLVAYSAPIFVVLFFLFPRFNFALFNHRNGGAQTGFSGKVRPGSISKLAQSDQVAFRAFFHSDFRPPVSRLYWRGAVLEEGGGLEWDPDSNRWNPLIHGPTEDQVEIMVESANSPWVFTLDWPVGVVMSSATRQSELREASGATYTLNTPLQERESYSFTYDIEMPNNLRQDVEIERAKQIDEPSEKMAEFLKPWQKAKGKSEEALALVRDFFESGGFRYTLIPPKVDNVDDFLFTTRRGFCEHYAAASSLLLRHLGIPARIVVGYQGGSPSLMGDYWIVYQRDAHAWIEYWDEARVRWVRVDPTSWVAADRIAMGGQSYFERESSEAAGSRDSLTAWIAPQLIYWARRSRLLFDQAEVMWSTFLLRYDFRFQQNLLAKLGFVGFSRALLFGVLVIALVLMGVVASSFLKLLDRGTDDLGTQIYRELRNRLRRAGLETSQQQGPLTIARTAGVRWPQLLDELDFLFSRLIAARYGGQPLSESEAIELRKRLRRLKLDSAQHN